VGYPSGQRDLTVTQLAQPSGVRIPHPPPLLRETDIQRTIVNFRAEIIGMLRKCMIFTMSGEKVDSSVFSDHTDVPLSSLNIDSLSAMQLCIELENEFGWSITPEELIAFESLGELERALEAHVGR